MSLVSRVNFVPTDFVCCRVNRQRRWEVMPEGDGEDDHQEERLSQQQTGMFSVCCEVLPVPFEAPELFNEEQQECLKI